MRSCHLSGGRGEGARPRAVGGEREREGKGWKEDVGEDGERKGDK